MRYKDKSKIRTCCQCGIKFVRDKEKVNRDWIPINGNPLEILCKDCYEQDIKDLCETFNTSKGSELVEAAKKTNEE